MPLMLRTLHTPCAGFVVAGKDEESPLILMHLAPAQAKGRSPGEVRKLLEAIADHALKVGGDLEGCVGPQDCPTGLSVGHWNHAPVLRAPCCHMLQEYAEQGLGMFDAGAKGAGKHVHFRM